MVDGVNGSNPGSPIRQIKSAENGGPDSVEIRVAARNYIKDRLINLPQAFFNKSDTDLKQQYTAAFTHFINAWTDPQTQFFFYKDKSIGDFLIPSNTQFNASAIGANNQTYIDVTNKISTISRDELAKHLDFTKVKTKLAQIRDGILAGSIKSSDISRKADDFFQEDSLAPRESK